MLFSDRSGSKASINFVASHACTVRLMYNVPPHSISTYTTQGKVSRVALPEQEVCHIKSVLLPISLCHYTLKHIQPARHSVSPWWPLLAVSIHLQWAEAQAEAQAATAAANAQSKNQHWTALLPEVVAYVKADAPVGLSRHIQAVTDFAESAVLLDTCYGQFTSSR